MFSPELQEELISLVEMFASLPLSVLWIPILFSFKCGFIGLPPPKKMVTILISLMYYKAKVRVGNRCMLKHHVLYFSISHLKIIVGKAVEIYLWPMISMNLRICRRQLLYLVLVHNRIKIH